MIQFKLAIGTKLHTMYFNSQGEMDYFIKHLHSFSRAKFTYEWKEMKKK